MRAIAKAVAVDAVEIVSLAAFLAAIACFSLAGSPQ
jgi:hypothetical protein